MINACRCDYVQLTPERSGTVLMMWTIRTTQRHSIFPLHLVNSLDYSWEPPENFHDCERLLDSFWEEVGQHKRERSREGVEIFPREQWIGTHLL